MKSAYSSLSYNTFPEGCSQICFDTVLDTLGFGVYQVRIFAIMCLMALSEGAHVMAFTLMLPILQHQWMVSDMVNGLQASFVFLAFLLGSITSGQISDRIGRKYPCFYAIIAFALFSMASAWSNNIGTLIILRIVAGISVGFHGPLGGTILTEITPKNLRGKYMTFVSFCLVLGQLYAAFVGYFLLENLDRGNWRVLLIYCSIPSIFAALMGFFYLDESPRYLIFVKRYEEAFSICEKITSENETEDRSAIALSKDSREKIVAWAEKREDEDAASLSLLFKGQKQKITLLIWGCWFSTSFIYYGIIIYLPLILQKMGSSQLNENGMNHGILQIFTSNFMELMSILGAAVLIENKFFGRKNSMIVFFSVTALITMMMYFLKDHLFMVWVTIARISISLTFVFCFQYTSEVYDTGVRTTGLGMANGIGRIGGIIMPWICAELMQIDLYGPFAIFFLMSCGGALMSYWLPFDTREKDLDG